MVRAHAAPHQRQGHPVQVCPPRALCVLPARVAVDPAAHPLMLPPPPRVVRSGDIHAGDHTLMVVTERRGDGLFITEALPSAGPGASQGFCRWCSPLPRRHARDTGSEHPALRIGRSRVGSRRRSVRQDPRDQQGEESLRGTARGVQQHHAANGVFAQKRRGSGTCSAPFCCPAALRVGERKVLRIRHRECLHGMMNMIWYGEYICSGLCRNPRLPHRRPMCPASTLPCCALPVPPAERTTRGAGARGCESPARCRRCGADMRPLWSAAVPELGVLLQHHPAKEEAGGDAGGAKKDSAGRAQETRPRAARGE